MRGAPHVEEQLHDPRALAEGREAVQRLPAGHLSELCKAQKQEAEAATKRLREQWAEWWDLWQNEVSYPDKEDWQSAIWIGTSFAAVEQAAAVVERSLLDSPQFFGVSGNDEPDAMMAALAVRPRLRLYLDQAAFVPRFANAV